MSKYENENDKSFLIKYKSMYDESVSNDVKESLLKERGNIINRVRDAYLVEAETELHNIIDCVDAVKKNGEQLKFFLDRVPCDIDDLNEIKALIMIECINLLMREIIETGGYKYLLDIENYLKENNIDVFIKKKIKKGHRHVELNIKEFKLDYNVVNKK